MGKGRGIYVDPESIREMQRLQGKMAEYLAMSRGSGTGLIRKKITDVRIRLARAYKLVRSGRRVSTRVWTEFEQRQIRGRGIKVHNPSLLSRRKFSRTARKVRLNRWQRAVGREIAKRVRGAAYLAYQFTVARGWRMPKRDTPFHKRFTSGYKEHISTIMGDARQAILDMRVPGTDRMNRRYSIIPRVLRQTTADIELYLRHKHNQIARDTLVRKTGGKHSLGAMKKEFGEIQGAKRFLRAQSSAARRASEKALRMAVDGR